MLSPSIFKAYDIRGTWKKDWDEEGVYLLGQAIVSFFRPKIIIMGRDMRSSSSPIAAMLQKAFLEAGTQILDLGMCTTELTYFASFTLPTSLCIMITASHNPGTDNGLKITLPGAKPVGFDSGLKEIRNILGKAAPCQQQRGELHHIHLWKKYQQHVLQFVKLSPFRPLRVVIDAGNGMGGLMIDATLLDTTFHSTPVQIIKQCWTPDGAFPHHPADPSAEQNTEDLKKRVLEEQADMGIAYDGDADRIAVVDEQGRYIPGYYFGAMMVEYILQQQKNPAGKKIVHESRYTWAFQDIARKYQAIPVISRAGHTLIKQAMTKEKALFGAESSGHLFYQDNHYAESTLLSTLLVLKMVAEKGHLSKLAAPFFQSYPTSGEVNFRVADASAVLRDIEEHYPEAAFTKIDGLSAEFSAWRFNVRSSNTEPLLRLNVEGKTSSIVQERTAELQKLIQP